MAHFLKVKSAEEVLEIIRGLAPLRGEEISLDGACGRVLAESIVSPEPVPHFARSVMDGYAVRARDTFGASESLPALLDVVGEVFMGKPASDAVGSNQAVAIPTGGMLPDGADAVVMVEYTSPVDERTIEVFKPVAPGTHIIGPGEDVSLGERLFAEGWTLRPQDLGVLAALGIQTVRVHAVPRVAVLSTGDEVVPPSVIPVPPGKIRDINTMTLGGQVAEGGGRIGIRQLIPDDLDALVAACREAAVSHDVIMLSGGSSVGSRDFTLRILDAFPESELLFHGVAVRPGKPTILARLGEKLFWGLPGQPMSALMICRAFVLPSLAVLQGIADVGGLTSALAGHSCEAILEGPLPSVHGRTDLVPVALVAGERGLVAHPLFGKSAMISPLARSQGIVIIPEHVEGLDTGSPVTVHLFSPWNKPVRLA